MSKAILVANRKDTDKKTGGAVLWVTLYMLPKSYKKKDGTPGLYYPKREDALVSCCISKEDKPDDYAKFENVREGALCIPHYVVDDFTNKSKLAGVDVVPDTNKYSFKMLYEA